VVSRKTDPSTAGAAESLAATGPDPAGAGGIDDPADGGPGHSDEAANGGTGPSDEAADGGAGHSDDAANGGGALRCAACGEALVEGARFCEACGAATGGVVASASADAGGGAGRTAETPAPARGDCARCGGELDSDGYCTSCGHRAVEDVTVDDRHTSAFATHRGRRHHRNEDAGALATTSEGWAVLVVSDGVSVSPNPHKASAAAVAAAAGRLAGRPFGGPDDLAAAVADAHVAASAVPNDDDPHWTTDGTHPACTIVVAVVTGTAVHTANVGDARAHLLTPSAGGDSWTATQLTVDDSVAAEAVAQGIDAALALNLPGGHGITAWLGADAHGLDPHIESHEAGSGDVLLVCSDGLWNYAPTDEAMGDLLTATLPPPGTPTEPLAELSEQLVSWAVDQGGADNITVALTSLPGPAPAGRTDAVDHTDLEDNP
jgi:serine/threonine protein phosphatase PrpC